MFSRVALQVLRQKHGAGVHKYFMRKVIFRLTSLSGTLQYVPGYPRELCSLHGNRNLWRLFTDIYVYLSILYSQPIDTGYLTLTQMAYPCLASLSGEWISRFSTDVEQSTLYYIILDC